MTALRKFLLACTAGVVLLLIVIFAERYFLNRAEARGRKSGAAIQSAEDTWARDSAIALARALAQRRLDSAVKATAARFAQADTGFARVQVKYKDRIVHDTVVAEIVRAANADIAACKDNALACEVARVNAERDAAIAHLTIADRDTTILRLAHATIPQPRSCVPQTVLGGIVGAAAMIVFPLNRH